MRRGRLALEFKCFIVRRGFAQDFSILESSCMTKLADGSTSIRTFPVVRLRFDPTPVPFWVRRVRDYEEDLSFEMSDSRRGRRRSEREQV